MRIRWWYGVLSALFFWFAYLVILGSRPIYLCMEPGCHPPPYYNLTIYEVEVSIAIGLLILSIPVATIIDLIQRRRA